ncbi:MAG TPA: hypothetical protein VMF06_19435 [Candidatus Limnocylindria bacterium]|nr:hypothetical protein [Candidatus Limnocylindria bacterium]
MNKFFRATAIAAVLAATTIASFAADLSKLEGKWSTKKTSKDGESYTQVIEIKKDKFQFRIIKGTDDVSLYAEGTVKTETSGPFNVVKFTDIKAGKSETDTQSIDDDRTAIYMLGEDSWTMASNFDKDRDEQKPSVDVYTKVKK